MGCTLLSWARLSCLLSLSLQTITGIFEGWNPQYEVVEADSVRYRCS